MSGDDARFLRRRTRPTYEECADRVRIVDLFCGAGGMTLGAVEACRTLGVACDIALAMEIDSDISDIYSANFMPTVEDEFGNVRRRFDRAVGGKLSAREKQTKRKVGRVDVLLGGPPCQGHSNLNNHTRWADPKNALYLRMIRAAEVIEPEMVVIENVPGVRKDSQRVVDRAAKHLEALGYDVEQGDFSVAAIGVAQLRTRHVLIASAYRAPSVDSIVQRYRVRRTRTLRWALRDMAPTGNGFFDTAALLTPPNQARARWLLSHGAYDLPNELRPRCHRDDPHHTYKSMYGRLRWNRPAQTITTGFGSPGQGRYLHPSERRTLTPHEAARIQFFPDWFDFSSAPFRSVLARAIGNAVPPKLAFVLVRALLEARNASVQPDGVSGGLASAATG